METDCKIIQKKFGDILLDPDIYYRVYGTEKPRPYHKFKTISDLYINSKKRKGVYCRFAKRRNPVSLSRFLMNAKKGQIIDHKNRNPLDNRRCNLRTVNSRQNNLNKTCRNNTGFYGVCVCVCKGLSRLKAGFKDAAGKYHALCLPDTTFHRIICAFAHDKFVLQAGDEEYAPLNFACFKNEPFKTFLLEADLESLKEKKYRKAANEKNQ
jgi:hypothetical protein